MRLVSFFISYITIKYDYNIDYKMKEEIILCNEIGYKKNLNLVLNQDVK
jgi:hypothetical protein